MSSSAQRERRPSLGRRDHVAQLFDQLLGRRQHPLGQQADARARPTSRSGSRPRPPTRTACAGAAPRARRRPLPRAYDGGETEQADPFEQRQPGREPPLLQRERTRTAPPRATPKSASAWPAVGGASAASCDAAPRRGPSDEVAQPGAQAEAGVVGAQQALGVVEPARERQRGRAVADAAGEHGDGAPTDACPAITSRASSVTPTPGMNAATPRQLEVAQRRQQRRRHAQEVDRRQQRLRLLEAARERADRDHDRREQEGGGRDHQQRRGRRRWPRAARASRPQPPASRPRAR